MSWRGCAFGVVLALAACGEPQSEGAVVAELRALRQDFARGQTTSGELTATASALRELLAAVERERAALRDLHGEVRADLQRLAAAPALPAAGADATRIGALERSVAELEQRMQASESVVARSLDTTTALVLRILEQLQANTAAVATGNEGAAPSAPAAAPAATADAALQANATRRAEALDRARASSRDSWLVAILVLGVLAIAWLAFRLIRRPAAAMATSANGADMSTDELWAAAGLLGEAVGRLRGTAPVAAPIARPVDAATMTRATTAPMPEVAAAELFEVEDGDELLAGVDWDQVVPDPVRAAAPPPDNGHGEPPRWSVRLETADPVAARAAVDACLQADPRVLRVPPPTVRAEGRALVIAASLLPGLLDGEREHLRATLQRLLVRS